MAAGPEIDGSFSLPAPSGLNGRDKGDGELVRRATSANVFAGPELGLPPTERVFGAPADEGREL